jgi:cytochrome c biogenesis protein CcdA
MNAKIGAFVMGGFTLLYCLLLTNTAIKLISADHWIGKAMGVLLLVFPLVAVAFTVREFLFGVQLERLSKRIDNSGQWPLFDLELRPSGRPTKESANANFVIQKQKVENNEHSYLNWFALGLAYDAAGDRRRARESMRQAIKLSSRE